ncbi:ACT domain-containing protein, partial [Photobacterium sanctipauli]
VFKGITLTVHSSLEAVGLTAAVATRLAEYSISANVVAAYYHDHVFVPVNRAEEALQALATMNTP